MGCLLALALIGLTAGGVALFGYAPWLMIVLGLLWLAAAAYSFVAGHHGFGGRGNTDVQILLAALGLTAAVLLPKYIAHQPAPRAREALRQVAAAEAQYFAAHGAYTADLGLLKATLEPDPDLAVAVTRADEKGFAATATHRGYADAKGALRPVIWDSAKGGLQP